MNISSMKRIAVFIIVVVSSSIVISSREKPESREDIFHGGSVPYMLDTLTAASEIYRHAPDLRIYFMYPLSLPREGILPTGEWSWHLWTIG